VAAGVAFVWEDEINMFSEENTSVIWRNATNRKSLLSPRPSPNTTTLGDGEGNVLIPSVQAENGTISPSSLASVDPAHNPGAPLLPVSTNATFAGPVPTTTPDANATSSATTNPGADVATAVSSEKVEPPTPPPPEIAVPSKDILLMPPKPDPKSVYMMNKAFADDNETFPFPHDAVSRNASLCPPTSQIQINLQDWTFQTYAPDGTKKTIGGDELYIYYEDGDGNASHTDQRTTATCISLTTDRGDGTYSLNFTTHPYLNASIPLKETGRLQIWLEYSCGVGSIMRPFKDSWKTIGAIMAHWTAENVPRPPMNTFVPPNSDHAIDLGQIKSIMAGGDSVMQHFVSPRYNYFYWANLSFGKNLRDCLLNRSAKKQFQLVKNRLKNFYSVHQNVGVILGFAAWELQKPYGNEWNPIPGQPYDDAVLFPEHLNQLSVLIQQLRSSFPGVQIFFKTGSYLHLHIVARDHGDAWENSAVTTRIHYMSYHRTMFLYEKQKELMRQLDVPILDVMEGSYLIPDRSRIPGDAMHYDVDTNKFMLDWFYPDGLNKTLFNLG
jgi:hypothetical protein